MITIALVEKYVVTRRSVSLVLETRPLSADYKVSRQDPAIAVEGCQLLNCSMAHLYLAVVVHNALKNPSRPQSGHSTS